MQNTENIDTEYKDFKEYLSIQNNRVKNNITEVNVSDLQFPFMLHIDRKPPVKFYPMMPRSAAPTEDNTVPRITVADTLIGCVLAYSRSLTDFFDREHYAGYIISKLKFNYCIKPTNKLVFDAEKTGEHWFIGYNKNSLIYKPETIGKIFLHEAKVVKKSIPNVNENKLFPVIEELVCYIELEESIKLNDHEVIDKGYYKLKLFNDFLYTETYMSKKNYELDSITLKDYMKAKQMSAVLLSQDSIVFNW